MSLTNITDLTNTVWIMKEKEISHHSYAQYNLTGKISAETTDGYKEVVTENGETAKNFILGIGTYNSASIFYINDGQHNNLPYFYFSRNAASQPEVWNYKNGSGGLSYPVTGSVIIKITGGSDATNSELIAWFMKNGRLAKGEIDLSAISGWGQVSFGNHNVYIRAKSNGEYADSNASASVTVRKNHYYNVTVNLEHITSSDTSWRMRENETRTIRLKASSGYILPTYIDEIANVTSDYELNSDRKNANLTLSNPTGNVNFTISAEVDIRKLSTPSIVETDDTKVVFLSDDDASSYEVFYVDEVGRKYSIGESAGEIVGYTVTSIKTYSSTDAPIYIQHANGEIETINTINASTSIEDVIKIASSKNIYVSMKKIGTQYYTSVQGGYDSESHSMTSEALTIDSDVEIQDILIPECIDENTLITMYDGTKKMMKDINVGDVVMSIDFDNMCLVGRKVIYSSKDDADYDKWVVPVYYKYTFSDGTVIRRAMRHRFYNLESSSYKHLTLWDTGEHSYNLSGENPELVGIDVIQSPLHYARITLEDSNNFFVNGLSTGDSECPSGIVLDRKLYKG